MPKKTLTPIVIVAAIIAAILVLLGLKFGLGIGKGGKGEGGEKKEKTPPQEQVKPKEGTLMLKVSGSHNDLSFSVDGQEMKDADAILKAAEDRKAGAIMIWFDQDPSRDKLNELYQELKDKAQPLGIIVYEPEKTPER